MADKQRRSVQDLGGAQIGESRTDNAAGRDINHIGVDLDALLRFVEGVRHSSDALAAAVVRLHERVAEMDKAARRAEQDAAMERGIDFEARLKRQAQLDTDFTQVRDELATLRREQHAVRLWLAALTFALLVALAALAVLVWREAAVLALATWRPW